MNWRMKNWAWTAENFGGGSGGVVSSNLDLLGGAAESIIFFMVPRSSGTSIHSTSETKNWLSSFFFSTK